MDIEVKENSTILVVDDDDTNRRLLNAMLGPMGYNVIEANNGRQAIEILEKDQPDVILMDIMMPELDGFEATRQIKSHPRHERIPIVMITALRDTEDRVKALEAGADDFLTKPVEKTELRARVASLCKVKAYYDHMAMYQKKLEKAVTQRTEELNNTLERLKSSNLETIIRLTRAAEYKDEDTAGHIQRISRYTHALGEGIGLSQHETELLLYAAPMHDIGKIGIPDKILLKPGKLNEKEWDVMKKHTVFGSKILEGSDSEIIALGETIARTHHEKWDGSGYPNGLSGKDIPCSGRITAIADVFDALLSKRPYKKPMTLEFALNVIKEGKGTHFDPNLVDVFFDIQENILEIKDSYSEYEETMSMLYKLADY